MTTALTLYGSNVSATTLANACKLSTTTGGTETSTTTTAPNDSTQNYMEWLSKGGSGTDSSSIPNPSGKGWLLDSSLLASQTLIAGNWSAVIRANDTAGFTAVTFIMRFYKYASSGSTYTSIGTLTLASQSMSSTTTTYSFSASSLPQMSFASSGEFLYCDIICHPITGHWTGDPMQIFLSNSGTAGVANDLVITTPGYNSPVNKDIVLRGKVSALTNKDIVLRGKISQLTRKDIVLRGNVGNTVRKDIVVRGKLSAQINKYITLRGKVSNKISKDIVIRGNVIARNTSGGGVLWANCNPGTATFKNFRWTQYPDPALSCAPVLPQVNTSEAFWNENIPTNTSRTMYTSIDGVTFTDVSASNGESIPGIVSQGAVQTDLWTADTSANYTNTHKTGGSNSTVTYDTSNSRVTLSGGSGGLYLLNAVSSNKIDVLCDMDRSDAGGLCWCFVDASNYYELGVYDDSSSGGFTNALRLYKVLANSRSLLASAAITFPRSTTGASPYHRTRVTMNASGVINVYFDTLTAAITYTDGSPLGAGKAGLRNDGGTSRYYQLRIQALGDYVSGTPSGDIVTSTFVYTKQSLSSTDPTATPQIKDLTTAVRSPSVDSGVLMPQLHDPTRPFASMYNQEFDTISQASGDYHWSVASDSYLSFNLRGAKISPWILYSTDLLFAPSVTPASSADLYCNRIKLTNVTYTTSQSEQKVADGSATSWQMAYPLYSAPTITVNGVVQTVGIQGQDTGKSYYWQSGSTSISQDASATKLTNGTIITFAYIGTYLGTVTRDNLTEQAARAAVEGNSGIVEVIIDASTVFGSGVSMNVSQAQAYGDGYLTRFSNNNAVSLTCTTTSDLLGSRPKPQKGMLLPTFIPEHNLNNVQLLITKVTTTAVQKADTNILYYYAIEATNGASLQGWLSVFKGV